MAGHLLGLLEPPVVFQVNRDAGRPPGVTSDWSEKTLVPALFTFVSRRGRVARRTVPARRSRHGVAMGSALRPGNGTTFALEAQTTQR